MPFRKGNIIDRPIFDCKGASRHHCGFAPGICLHLNLPLRARALTTPKLLRLNALNDLLDLFSVRAAVPNELFSAARKADAMSKFSNIQYVFSHSRYLTAVCIPPSGLPRSAVTRWCDFEFRRPLALTRGVHSQAAALHWQAAIRADMNWNER